MKRSSLPLLLICVLLAFAHQILSEKPPPSTLVLRAAPTNSAVQSITEGSDASKINVLSSVKAATDGIQLAISSAASKDTSRMLKGIGDAVATLPGAFGLAGIGFSVAASVFALFGGGGKRQDPVLAALNQLHSRFDREMAAIETAVQHVSDQVNAVITGIDQILNSISDIPAKVVAEMKLTDVTTMKDKFAYVQRAAEQYAHGNLSRDQMVAKCDDFNVAALFSELETILKDEKDLFGAKFGAQDRTNGGVQVQLLVFYMAAVPLVTNCNALKYSIESLEADGERIHGVVKFAHARAVWYLTEPDRAIHVRESFSPFASVIDTNGYREQPGWTLALSFKAYSYAPPHAKCFKAVDDGKRLVSIEVKPVDRVPTPAAFCMKESQGDDAPHRIVYAERRSLDSSTTTSILQPEIGDDFDPLNQRGWTSNTMVMYSANAARWTRLPRLRIISDLIVLQAKNSKVSVDEITKQCRSLGSGYDRDGDAHSKDYDTAPWTIFCVEYAELTLREVGSSSRTFLSAVQFNDMEARDAWTASCPLPGFRRDSGQISIPSKVKKQFFGGYSTLRAYAVCLKWEPMTIHSIPSQFQERVWLDDSAPMAEKAKQSRHFGDTLMALPAPPPLGQLDQF